MGKWTMGYTDDVLSFKIKELICASIDRLSNQECPHTRPNITYEDVVQDLDQGDMFCNKLVDLLVYELADRRKRSRASDRRAICERTSYGLRHLSRTSVVLDDRSSIQHDPRISEAYSSYREPDVSFINMDGNRMHTYSEDEEDRLLSDMEIPLTHTSALHDIYSAPSVYSTMARPMSPPFEDSPVEESVRSPRLDRRSMSFAEFLSSMSSSQPPPPPPQRNTDLIRRPTLHRRDFDHPSRRRNRSRSARPTTGSNVQTNEPGNFWGDYERVNTMPTTISRRTFRHNSDDGISSSRSRPSSSRHRSFHSGGSSSSGSSRLRRGGVQPPELIATQTNVEGTLVPDAPRHRPEHTPTSVWDARDEFLTSLPTPRSTSPDVTEGQR